MRVRRCGGSFVRMKKPLPAIGALLFAACTGTTTPDPRPAPDTARAPIDTPSVPVVWTGYYNDTLPCADCPGIDTWLWVRADSTFILREQRIDCDSVPFGTIGQWHVVHGLITVGYTGDKPYFFRATHEGLELVDEMGEAGGSGEDLTLDKYADELSDAIPRMRLAGTYVHDAGAQRFQPCGSRFAWPCAGGMDLGEEEGEPVIDFGNADLHRLYRKAVKNDGDPWVIEAICTLGMGPAAEGDGADEYVYIEQAPRTIEHCP